MEFSSPQEINEWIMKQCPFGVMLQGVDRLLGQSKDEMVIECRERLMERMREYPNDTWRLVGSQWYVDEVMEVRTWESLGE